MITPKIYSRRYSLKPGFIGPLTRRQALNRERNQRNAQKKRQQKALSPPKVYVPDDYDMGTFFDNFVDGFGF